MKTAERTRIAFERGTPDRVPIHCWLGLPLIKKLLDAGANPNDLINSTPRARMREGSPRLVYATVLTRAALARFYRWKKCKRLAPLRKRLLP